MTPLASHVGHDFGWTWLGWTACTTRGGPGGSALGDTPPGVPPPQELPPPTLLHSCRIGLFSGAAPAEAASENDPGWVCNAGSSLRGGASQHCTPTPNQAKLPGHLIPLSPSTYATACPQLKEVPLIYDSGRPDENLAGAGELQQHDQGIAVMWIAMTRNHWSRTSSSPHQLHFQ